jgi:hypothetical protein
VQKWPRRILTHLSAVCLLPFIDPESVRRQWSVDNSVLVREKQPFFRTVTPTRTPHAKPIPGERGAALSRGEGAKFPHRESSSRAVRRGQRGREPPANCPSSRPPVGGWRMLCGLERDGASAAAKPGAIQSAALRLKGGGGAQFDKRPCGAVIKGDPYSKCMNGSPAMTTSSSRMSVKSDCPCSPGTCVCGKNTSHCGPDFMRHAKNRRCSVRSCPALNRPAWRRFISSHTVFACSPAFIAITPRSPVVPIVAGHDDAANESAEPQRCYLRGHRDLSTAIQWVPGRGCGTQS